MYARAQVDALLPLTLREVPLQALYAQRGIANGGLQDPYGAPILPNGHQIGSVPVYANGRTVSGAARRPASRAQSPTELAAPGGQPNGLRNGADGVPGSVDTVRAKSDTSRGHAAAEQSAQQRPSTADMALPAPQQLQRLSGHAAQHQLPSYAFPLANGGLPVGYSGGNGRRTPPAPRSEPDVRMYQSSQHWRGQPQKSVPPPPPPTRPCQPPSQVGSSQRGGGPHRQAELGRSQASWPGSSSAPDATAVAQGHGGRLPGAGISAAVAGPVMRQPPGASSQSAPVSPRFGSVPAAALSVPGGTAGMPGLTLPRPQPHAVPAPFAAGGPTARAVPSLPPPTLQSPPPLTVPQMPAWQQASANGPVPADPASFPGDTLASDTLAIAPTGRKVCCTCDDR